MRVYNANGCPFHVRIVRAGEHYGLEDCLTHEGGRDVAMVEFYDASVGPKFFGERGQFVSRYYVDTLLKHRGGLTLDGGVPEWVLDAGAVEQAQRHVRHELAETP